MAPIARRLASAERAGAQDCPLLPGFCEVKARGQWHVVRLQDAWRFNSRRLIRCAECHGRIRVGAPGRPAVPFEHVEPHGGCFFCLDFDGTPRPHPNPLT